MAAVGQLHSLCTASSPLLLPLSGREREQVKAGKELEVAMAKVSAS